MSTLNNLRSEILESLNQGHKPRLVLDLDSTLFCVSPRTQFILRQFSSSEFAKRFANDHKEALAKIQQVSTTPRDWGIGSSLIRHDVRGRLDFFEAVRLHWIQHFFSNEMLVHDEPYEGAVEFVLDCHQKGAHIGYLTGRDVPRMGTGTLEQLKRWGLPLDDPEDLQMKPHTGLDDIDYKVGFFSHLDGDLSRTWFVDNEPTILHAVAERIPQVNIVYADTVHSGRQQPSSNWPKIGYKWKV
ncbi:MAG: HAD family hydrolase [Pseudomonadota bacterium]